MSSEDTKAATSASLALPTSNADVGLSETPSRAETLIEKTEAEETAERATNSSEEKLALEENEKNQAVDLEKGAKFTDNAVVAEGAKSVPDDERYITGFRLFLVFVYVEAYIDHLYANTYISGLLLSIFLVALDQTIIGMRSASQETFSLTFTLRSYCTSSYRFQIQCIR